MSDVPEGGPFGPRLDQFSSAVQPTATPPAPQKRSFMTRREAFIGIGSFFAGSVATVTGLAAVANSINRRSEENLKALRDSLEQLDKIVPPENAPSPEREVPSEDDFAAEDPASTAKVKFLRYRATAEERGATYLEARERLSKTIAEESKGRLVIVDYYGDWCIGCRGADPHVMPGAEKSGLEITVIKVQDEFYKEGNFLKQTGYFPEMHIIKDGKLLGIASSDNFTRNGRTYDAGAFAEFIQKSANEKNPKPWPLSVDSLDSDYKALIRMPVGTMEAEHVAQPSVEPEEPVKVPGRSPIV
jgi:thiol-disulfide isomerase/thioredoxin